jgi:hypothetical protein
VILIPTVPRRGAAASKGTLEKHRNRVEDLQRDARFLGHAHGGRTISAGFAKCLGPSANGCFDPCRPKRALANPKARGSRSKLSNEDDSQLLNLELIITFLER